MAAGTDDVFQRDFATFSQIVGWRAEAVPDKLALADPSESATYSELDRDATLIAATLQRAGIVKGDTVAICALNSVRYVVAMLGILRAGAVIAPIAPSSTPDSICVQIVDSAAKLLFLDMASDACLQASTVGVPIERVVLDDPAAPCGLAAWLARDAVFVPVDVGPDDAFNIIYSSGTTGVPKGIVHSHAMRWAHISRATYPVDGVTLASTPLYSNTTLVSVIPALAAGGTVILMPRFDARLYLELAEQYRVTHTMLVPVQYRRLLDDPTFDDRDLSAFRVKFATSSPFEPAMKRQVLDRWPGGLVEFYGSTEGGGVCALFAHKHPDKLHTVGKPLPGHDIRLIDEDGHEVPTGQIGEIVGRSGAMMSGYHRRAELTSETQWHGPNGDRFIRSGDLGRFDEDGFLVLMGRKKDLIISGGFNVYPGDLEQALRRHPAVSEAAVIGVPSPAWGETPVGFVTLHHPGDVTAAELRDAANACLGKTQRLSAVRIVESLPRSPIGKVLKVELRDEYLRSEDR